VEERRISTPSPTSFCKRFAEKFDARAGATLLIEGPLACS
jgi:hypothetical protein